MLGMTIGAKKKKQQMDYLKVKIDGTDTER